MFNKIISNLLIICICIIGFPSLIYANNVTDVYGEYKGTYVANQGETRNIS